MESSINVTPKRHFLGRQQVTSRIDRQNRSTGAGSARRASRRMKQKRNTTRRYTKNQHVKSHVFVQATHVVATPCTFARMVTSRCSYIFRRPCGDYTDMLRCLINCRFIIISIKWHRNPFKGLGAPAQESKFALSRYFGYWLLQQLALSYKPYNLLFVPSVSKRILKMDLAHYGHGQVYRQVSVYWYDEMYTVEPHTCRTDLSSSRSYGSVINSAEYSSNLAWTAAMLVLAVSCSSLPNSEIHSWHCCCSAPPN